MKKLTPEEQRKREDRLAAYSEEDRVESTEVVKASTTSTEEGAQKTGVATIDRLLNGVEPGELVIVSGPTGEGKTTLLMSITQNMAKAELPAVWFTLEVTPQAFLRKIEKAAGHLPHFYMPMKNTDNQLDWLEERIIEAKVKYNVQAVFIDHIHQIFSMHRMNNPNISLELGDMVGRIKQMAIDHHLVIFLIAHTRDNSEKTSAEPRKEDIRDSGLISRLADVIILVWRVKNSDSDKQKRRPDNLEENDTKAKIRIVKNRREGRLGTFFMEHENGYLKELDNLI